MFKKLFIALMACAAIATSAMAANTNTSLFSANELNLGVGTAYTLGSTKATAFANPYQINVQADGQYFFTKYLGVEVDVPFYQSKGVSVREASGGLVARLPIGFVAPYAGLSYDYNWNERNSSYILRGGFEFRIFKRVGFFAEYQRRGDALNFDGSNTLFGGLRLRF